MMRLVPGTLAIFFASCAAVHASIVISSASSQNMSCSSGVCTPTDRNAVLNVTDLENMLAAGALEITTTGSGAQALNIVVTAPLGWSSTNALTLQAYQSIAIQAPVSVAGASALTLSAYDGELSFGDKGSVTFQNLSSGLTIDGTSFTLVDSIASLVGAIASDPAGVYALANPYDASGDGTYTHAPVRPEFSGLFEGLGNTISNLTVDDPLTKRDVGLFAEVGGTVRDIGLVGANISAGKRANVGALIGLLDTGGAVSGSYATGSVSAGSGEGVLLGGLIGNSSGDVSLSHAKVSVSDAATKKSDIFAGGLIGISFGSVEQSYSEGPVEITGAGYFGGFVGQNALGTITNCYATGAVSASNSEAAVGGFAGTGADSSINESYATGAVNGGDAYAVGGFVGTGGYGFANDYWDTTTSGQNYGTGNGNVSGLTGLTSAQLQSGLPSGFPSDIWAEKTRINKGFPYLLDNRP
jgi:hypothetical protein